MVSKMNIYIIRHGETDLNVQGRLQGHIDYPLNAQGIRLGDITGKALEKISFDYIFTSPLERAVETARLASQYSSSYHHAEIPVIKDSRLMEINWGSWDTLGCTRENFEIPSHSFQDFYKDPFRFRGPKDGETISQVCERTGDFWKDLISNPLYENKTVLISAHGCSVKGLLYQIKEDKTDFWGNGVPRNCSVSLITISDGVPVLNFEDRIYYDSSLSNNPYQFHE